MIKTRVHDKFIDKFIAKISVCSPVLLIIYSSLFVSLLSASIVYIVTSVCGEEHTVQLFRFSVVIPLLTTPVIVSILIVLTKHLKHFQYDLDEAIEKNKEKDIMLFEQARFALMGEMMANISHQWRQPLNTVGLAIVSMRTSPIVTDECDEKFDIIEDNIRYLSSTIDDFLSFFDKRTNLEMRTLFSIVKEIRSIIETQISNENIELNINIENSAKDIKIVSSISQVILNILNNSKDAFTQTTKDKKITLSFALRDKALEIICIDNGKGIAQDIEDKIFDPYFSTKDKSQGTGIGLYMSKQIVQKLFGGDIKINSFKNTKADCQNKTCFYIRIPLSDKCSTKNS